MKVIADTLRVLACEMIHKANSGHSGICLGFADVVTALLNEISFDCDDPDWINRDRVIFSCGHGSALWYSVLYGFGILNKDDLNNFRQLGSKTPGHLELGQGVDITTGPLGMGFSWGIGMALAERILHQKHEEIDHNTFILCSDGDLMEGVSYEAAQIAGHYALHKLIVLFDDNSITIDGACDGTRSEDMQKRFEAQNWHYIKVDGHNILEVQNAIKKAKQSDAPTIIACKTNIGKHTKFENTSAVHGKPLNKEELDLLKNNLEYNEEKFFAEFEKIKINIRKKKNKLNIKLGVKIKKTEELAIKLKENYATRKHSKNILQDILKNNDNLIIASADLSTSCGTDLDAKIIDKHDYSGNILRFGVCEGAMFAVMGGLTLHGGLVGVASTFLTFFDYARPAIRLASMMNVPLIMIGTHDSIAVGEDGPTHQPIEHLDSLRCIPNLLVTRPADGFETFYCYEKAIKQNRPAVLALTRQGLNSIHNDYIKEEDLCFLEENKKNGYIISTGSEVSISLKVACELDMAFISMPIAYKIDLDGKIFVVEASSGMCWNYFIKQAQVLNITEFGASGKCEDVLNKFEYMKEKIKAKVIQ